MIDLHKKMYPDSRIAAEMVLHRKRGAAITSRMGDLVKEKLICKLKQNKFSLIIDETTDCSLTKTCAILARYFDQQENCCKTEMLDMVNVYAENPGGSTGESLFNILINSLNSSGIPLYNMVGFAADGASNIMGKINSVSSRLRREMPGITIIKCVAHSIHLCSSEAAKTLPRSCEELIRNVYNFFAHSAKRKFEFKEYQLFCNIKPHKLLHPCATRWLSLHSAVSRLIEQWQPLTLYFSHIMQEEKMIVLEKIHQSLKDQYVFIYLHFMNYILPYFNRVNLKFQSKSPTLHLLHNELTSLQKTLLEKFCYSHVTAQYSLNNIDPSHTAHHKPVNEIYLGPDIHKLFQKPEYHKDPKLIPTVKTTCRDFLIAACQQIKQRFDFDNKLWALTCYLSPIKMLDHNSRTAMPSITDLMEEVPLINTYSKHVLDDQWREIPFYKFPEEINGLKYDAEKFYNYIMKIRDDSGHFKFQAIAKFSLEVLSLPTSNADVERLFSKLNRIKRKERNSLKNENVRALIHISEYAIKSNGDPDNDLVSQFVK